MAATLIVATIAFCLIAWFLRRPHQLLHPYVWDETYEQLDAHRFHGLVYEMFTRVNGYFILPSSITVGIASSLSLLPVPVVEYWLTTAWSVGTLCLVLIPRSGVPLTWRMGLAVLLVVTRQRRHLVGSAILGVTGVVQTIGFIDSPRSTQTTLPLLPIRFTCCASSPITPSQFCTRRTRDSSGLPAHASRRRSST